MKTILFILLALIFIQPAIAAEPPVFTIITESESNRPDYSLCWWESGPHADIMVYALSAIVSILTERSSNYIDELPPNVRRHFSEKKCKD